MENFTTSILKRRRLLHTILLAIILATLPCYCAGAMLLGLAPDRDRIRITSTAIPTLVDATLLTQVGPTPTATLFPTITPLPAGVYTNTPIFGGPVQTPGQYVPPTNTPWPTLTPTRTFTLPPTATFALPTSTTAPTITPTFTWTWTPTATSTTPAAATATQTRTSTATLPPTQTLVPTLTFTPTLTATVQTVPTETSAPLPTPTVEVLEDSDGG